jgi:two-component system CheB/CheR fusion protein
MVTKKTKVVKKQKVSQDEADFPIIGIGASAGGLEALGQFFENTPIDCGMAFVVIQHLDPTHVGIMPELLQRITEMKVYQATDSLKIKTNSVYVIPPNKSMSILNGHLHLFEPTESRGLRLPVDVFFRSLADDRQDKSIGVILSGMGSDGSLGVSAIKEKEGVVLIQTPDTAKFDGMPRSAIDAVIADIIAPAEELSNKLISFLHYVPVSATGSKIDTSYKSNLDKIIILLREQTGHDFSLYKKNTLFRRIERRKGVHQIDKISKYVRFLQDNPKEIGILFKELLIGVTSFFRDPGVWEKLKNDTLPTMFNELHKGDVLRAWVTACSTGEEAYSLAIIFKEALEKSKDNKHMSLQIFATDIDADAIEKARKGFFPAGIVTDVTPQRLKKYFVKEESGYRLNAAIREMVVFAPQDVIKDPPFTKLDILTCRNMLIYMEPELQVKLMSLFNYTLNPGGIMVLGTAESLGNSKEGFIEVDPKLKIFKRSSKPTSAEFLDFPSAFHRNPSRRQDDKVTPTAAENIQAIAEQTMLQRFSPASVMVNDDGDILFITGRTGKYLEPAAGKTNINIYAMARTGLSDVLPGAFRKAIQNYDPVVLRKIKLGNNGSTQLVDVTVQRIEHPNSVRNLVMVVFTDVDDILKIDAINSKTGKLTSKGRQKELEHELARSFQDIQGLREEMQTSQEELKSTNEELQSTNEELQSTNEELTTSKEEMQSLNEELQTVNVELQCKVSDSIDANNDMKNLLNSTEIATLFLDRELNVRRFTDSLTYIFKLRQADIGRPFTDQVSDLKYPNIGIDCNHVLKTLRTKESLITTSDGRWFDVRIMPYRTLDDHIDGLVITFNDITVTKSSVDELHKSKVVYQGLLQNLEVGIIVHAPDTSIIMTNPKATEILGISDQELKGKHAKDSTWKFVDEENTALSYKDYPVNKILENKTTIKNQIIGSYAYNNKDLVWVSITGFPVFDDTGTLSEVVISFIDITNSKEKSSTKVKS